MKKRTHQEKEDLLRARKEAEAARPKLTYIGVVRNAAPAKVMLDLAYSMSMGARERWSFREDLEENLLNSMEKMLADIEDNEERVKAVYDLRTIPAAVTAGIVIDDGRHALVAWSMAVLKMAEDGMIRPDEQAVLMAILIHDEARDHGEYWAADDWGMLEGMAGRMMNNLLATEVWQLPISSLVH